MIDIIKVILTINIGTDTKKRSNEDDEEIIAESYDEPANDKSNIEVRKNVNVLARRFVIN